MTVQSSCCMRKKFLLLCSIGFLSIDRNAIFQTESSCPHKRDFIRFSWGNRPDCVLFPFLHTIFLDPLVIVIQADREIKECLQWGDRTKCFCTGCGGGGNTQKSLPILLNSINSYSKLSQYNIDLHKSYLEFFLSRWKSDRLDLDTILPDGIHHGQDWVYIQ